MSFSDFFWLLIWGFFFVAYLLVLFRIFDDLVRDDMSGGLKALWVLVLLIFPLIGMLIYLIARGGGMAERQAKAARQMQADAATLAAPGSGVTSSSVDQIAAAKSLLDSGTISQAEFDQLKQKALS